MNIIKHDFIFESTLIQYNDRVGWLRANELYGKIYAVGSKAGALTL